MQTLNLTLPAVDAALAVAVSGGADSMALVCMLAQHHVPIHAISVDHGLRPESAQECERVGIWLSKYSNIKHVILRWNGDKPAQGVMEAARYARYALMADYCVVHGIQHLALGHHRDDQAETLLMRLAHGSGVDGLAAMREFQPYNADLILWRPLLNKAGHDDLVAYCQAHNIEWIEDPSNTHEKYLRPRLRAARDVLEGEGLNAKRLAQVAARQARASEALQILTMRLHEKALKEKTDHSLVFDMNALRGEPQELCVRLLRHAIDTLGHTQKYGARYEKIEEMAGAIMTAQGAYTATLGGCVVRLNPKAKTLAICAENLAFGV